MGQRQGGQEVEDRNEREAKVIAFVGGFHGKGKAGQRQLPGSALPRCLALARR